MSRQDSSGSNCETFIEKLIESLWDVLETLQSAGLLQSQYKMLIKMHLDAPLDGNTCCDVLSIKMCIHFFILILQEFR